MKTLKAMNARAEIDINNLYNTLCIRVVHVSIFGIFKNVCVLIYTL